MKHFHCVVWIDHREAHILSFDEHDAERQTVRPEHGDRRLHHKGGAQSGRRSPEDQAFYAEVAKALAGAGALLITGPADAKTRLKDEIDRHHPELAKRVAGLETVDHPSDGELAALARRRFAALDRMTPQRA